MNKTLALVALLGLVSAPVFAAETAKDAKAEKVVAGEAKKEAKAEAKKEGEKAAEAAPAAGEAKEEAKKEEAKH